MVLKFGTIKVWTGFQDGQSFYYSKMDSTGYQSSVLAHILPVRQLKQKFHIGGCTQQMFDTAFQRSMRS